MELNKNFLYLIIICLIIMFNNILPVLRTKRWQMKTLLNFKTISKCNTKSYSSLFNPEMYKTTVEECMPTFHKLFHELTTKTDQEPLEISEHLKQILTYNVPRGKKTRIRIAVSTYKALQADKVITAENLQLAYTLGWCVEILNSAGLILDDMMDRSTQRRGTPCWYLVNNVGLGAINDKRMLQYCIFKILKKHLSGHPCYGAVIELFHKMTLLAHFGQCLEFVCQCKGGKFLPNVHTWDNYRTIIKYKALFYSLDLPVTLALHLSEMPDRNMYEQFHKITMEMGFFGQALNDFLDCYGDPSLTGKEGTDIQEGRCTWLLLKALEKGTPSQIKLLEENYGKCDVNKVFNVINLYRDLNLPNLFLEYKSGIFSLVSTEIDKISHDSFKLLFTNIWDVIYKTVK